ncbi:MAG: RHS repeat-associated core domain-containing protein [Pirellulales bacterium]
MTEEPVTLMDGQVQLRETDLWSTGFGQPWGHQRSYDNQLPTPTDFGNGFNWYVRQWSYLTQQGTTIILHRSANETQWFDYDPDTYYTGRYGILDRIDEVGGPFEWISPNGTIEHYASPAAPTIPGKLLRRYAPGKGLIELNYDGWQRVASVTRSIASSTASERFEYTYETSGPSARIISVTLRRRTNPDKPWSDVERVAYTYYGGDAADGTSGDLRTVVKQVPAPDGGWDDVATSYYRYYISGQANGFIHGLKYALNPAAFERAQTSLGDPLLATDSQIAKFADYYFEYDDQFRVTLERAAGGTLRYQLAYEENPSPSPDGANVWRWKTTVAQPDGSILVAYTNFLGQNMLHDVRNAANTERWITYWEYDASLYSVVKKASPSAVNMSASPIYNDAVDNLAVQLRASDGLITLFTYYNGTDGPLGYGKRRSMKKGDAGTVIKQRETVFGEYNSPSWLLYPLVQSTVWADEAGAFPIVTSYAYEFHTDTFAVWQRTTTLPNVSTAQNGSNLPTYQRMLYDIYGKLIWEQGPKGFVDNFSYDVCTGARIEHIRDVNPDLLPLPTEPETWTRPAGLPAPLQLVTNFAVDDRGRIVQRLGPVHSVQGEAVRTADWSAYLDADHEVRVARGHIIVDGSAPREALSNPVTIIRTDAGGVPLDSLQAVRQCSCTSPLDALPVVAGRLTNAECFARETWTAWSHTMLDDAGRTIARRVYYSVPSCGDGTATDHYDETRYGYDAGGRRNRVVSPDGTVTRTVFDALGRSIATWVGTDDWGATDADPSGGNYPGPGTTSNNMRPVSSQAYTPYCACPDPAVVTQYVDNLSLNDRVTTYHQDFRNRLTAIEGEENFYERRIYDNLNRLIQINRFDGPPNHPTTPTNFLTETKAYFDDRDNVYLLERYAVSGGAVQSEKIQEDNWYDAAGNLVRQVPMGAKDYRAFTKWSYDGDARNTAVYRGIYLGTLPIDYDDVLAVTGDDKVFEQARSTFDAAGNLIQSSVYQRFHDATGNGVLNLPTGTQPKARVSYSARYFDGEGHLSASADYGTNNNTTFTRPELVPNRSDDVLVTSYGYDAAGNRFQTIDPAGREVRQAFDAVGRETLTVENYSSSLVEAASGGVCPAACDGTADALPLAKWVVRLSAGNETNVAVGREYGPSGTLSALIAYNPSTGPQRTLYQYGVTLADGPLANNRLLRSVVYPDSSNSGDRVLYTYDRQAKKTSFSDQNGTVHEYNYDRLGRRTDDRVTTLGSTIDATCCRLSTTYNALGLPESFTSHSAPSGGSVLNEVRREYGSFQQLAIEYQEHSGAVNISTSQRVQYAYEPGSVNMIRPTTVTYPDSRVIRYDYGTSGGDDDYLSRPGSIQDFAGSTTYVAYTYLGLGTFVRADDPQPDVRWDLITGSGANPYSGLDRFGRVVDCLWRYYGASPADRERVQYGYDRASNRVWRKNTVAPSGGNDELYAYDGVQRLLDMSRGTLAAGNETVNSMTFAQDWSLDATGNWSGFRQTDASDATQNLDQQRTSNAANELTGLSRRYGTNWQQPFYDRNGNMRNMPSPLDPSNGIVGTYDAWNRLVYLGGAYQYDALNRRTLHFLSGNFRHFYYSADWQVFEERLGVTPNSAPAERQFIWGLRYIDDLVLRDRSPTNNGTLSERLYALQDANWNVTAVVNAGGDVQERYRYAAYGMPTFLNANFTTKTFGGSYVWETLYCGYRWDVSTGLYCVRFRYLHPLLGCWLTRDPMTLIVELFFKESDYSYGFSSPITRIDPSGLAPPAIPLPKGIQPPVPVQPRKDDPDSLPAIPAPDVDKLPWWQNPWWWPWYKPEMPVPREPEQPIVPAKKPVKPAVKPPPGGITVPTILPPDMPKPKSTTPSEPATTPKASPPAIIVPIDPPKPPVSTPPKC